MADEIDVLIPAIEKDLATLPLVIDAVRRYVKHPINKIYVVSPLSARIQKLCKLKNCTFVNEKKALPITKKNIHYSSSKWERSGWLYQQLLKMNGDQICKKPNFLVIDADTVFIRPHTFISKGKTIFYCRSWSQPEYYRTYKKLIGSKAPAPRSFVTHYMLFNRNMLAELKQFIEKKHRKVWYQAVIDSIDKTRSFGFSEYETYANYLYTKDAKRTILYSALNKSLKIKASTLKSEQLEKYALRYRSLSFHERKAYSKAR
ncbi:hypothetical protein DCC85_10115 [Paenibacillus sp. CAA11]|uniref:DUF6492 family protein n=1 Tax=Paenibacillus sp. CAA11 TaxID=1532905 RepID=UPI000D38D5A8|nr:DUF6492 family protein [Paenibacillus sp. CAA11]AWB44546.1 hypothetical protein DCC85_10115 [Paenibacillus sp. CAA11]